ncbi:MAG: 2-oxo acid dehydrogenase subunit E2 [Chloroflexi bacterium]|nr:2-oxo acid dehydrogenase subunit E2 [Chloroflexota bacterium]
MTESPRGLPVKETRRLTQPQKVMLKTMPAVTQTAALSQVNREIDVTVLQQKRRERGLSFNVMMMAAVSRALPAHPLLSAELVENQLLIYDVVNLGMAVAVPDGLIVVVIPKADQLTLSELDQAIQERVARSRARKLTLPDMEGGTFTVSNLGMYGIEGGFPLPPPPQSAILLVGAAIAKPAVFEGQIAIREFARFSVNFDHRFIDGAVPSAFLRDLNAFMGDASAWEQLP